jgi:hypothetical protein
MFVSQPEIPVPLVAEFPFPAWATRPDEVGPSGGGRSRPARASGASGDGSGRAGGGAEPEPADDPFAGLPGT